LSDDARAIAASSPTEGHTSIVDTSRQGSKIPVSTMIVIHDHVCNALLLERTDFEGYWQSVTGSQEPGESLVETATRELFEETGIDALAFGGVVDWRLSNVYEIYLQWRHRYPSGVTHNIEHVFGLCVPSGTVARLAVREHRAWCWLPWREAAAKCFSWSNREALLRLPESLAATAQCKRSR
jgi:dATP pyrophosphohydrolase